MKSISSNPCTRLSRGQENTALLFNMENVRMVPYSQFMVMKSQHRLCNQPQKKALWEERLRKSDYYSIYGETVGQTGHLHLYQGGHQITHIRQMSRVSPRLVSMMIHDVKPPCCQNKGWQSMFLHNHKGLGTKQKTSCFGLRYQLYHHKLGPTSHPIYHFCRHKKKKKKNAWKLSRGHRENIYWCDQWFHPIQMFQHGLEPRSSQFRLFLIIWSKKVDVVTGPLVQWLLNLQHPALYSNTAEEL